METIKFLIESDHSISEQLNEELQAFADGEILVAERNNVDGGHTVLQIVEVITSLASAITPIVALYLSNRKVKKIVFDKIEIENPTKEQWEMMWKEYLSRHKLNEKQI